MRVAEILDEAAVVEELKAKDKAGVLRELAEALARCGKVRDVETLVNALLVREGLGSTGIGDRVAIPHAKSAEIRGVSCAFGRSKKGVPFDSLDGKPACLFFLLVAGEESTGEHLKALAEISRLLKEAQTRSLLMKADSSSSLYRILTRMDPPRVAEGY